MHSLVQGFPSSQGHSTWGYTGCTLCVSQAIVRIPEDCCKIYLSWAPMEKKKSVPPTLNWAASEWQGWTAALGILQRMTVGSECWDPSASSPAWQHCSAQTECKINQMLKITIQKIFCDINTPTDSRAFSNVSKSSSSSGEEQKQLLKQMRKRLLYCFVAKKNQLMTADI